MSKRFAATQKVDLGDVSEGWDGAHIVIAVPSFGDIQTLTAGTFEDDTTAATATLAFVEEHFVSGKAPDGGTLVDLTAKDIRDLPVIVISRLTDALFGEKLLDPKS